MPGAPLFLTLSHAHASLSLSHTHTSARAPGRARKTQSVCRRPQARSARGVTLHPRPRRGSPTPGFAPRPRREFRAPAPRGSLLRPRPDGAARAGAHTAAGPASCRQPRPGRPGSLLDTRAGCSPVCVICLPACLPACLLAFLSSLALSPFERESGGGSRSRVGRSEFMGRSGCAGEPPPLRLYPPLLSRIHSHSDSKISRPPARPPARPLTCAGATTASARPAGIGASRPPRRDSDARSQPPLSPSLDIFSRPRRSAWRAGGGFVWGRRAAGSSSPCCRIDRQRRRRLREQAQLRSAADCVQRRRRGSCGTAPAQRSGAPRWPCQRRAGRAPPPWRACGGGQGCTYICSYEVDSADRLQAQAANRHSVVTTAAAAAAASAAAMTAAGSGRGAEPTGSPSAARAER